LPPPLPGTSEDLKWKILYLIAGDVLDHLIPAYSVRMKNLVMAKTQPFANYQLISKRFT
jgi:hypothetical protein